MPPPPHPYHKSIVNLSSRSAIVTIMGCINTKPSNVPLEENGEIEAQDQEKRIELHFKAKRQNVFTEGLDMDHAPPPKKVIPKTDSQKELISKFNIHLLLKSTDKYFQIMHWTRTLFLQP